MIKKILSMTICFLSAQLSSEEPTPPYLYKVLSAQDWEASSNQEVLNLPSADQDFIHFSREDQLDRILSKYWADVPAYYVLKVDVSKLPGKLVYEANPGGASKYYHLYDGSIPVEAIVETQKISVESGN